MKKKKVIKNLELQKNTIAQLNNTKLSSINGGTFIGGQATDTRSLINVCHQTLADNDCPVTIKSFGRNCTIGS